MPSPVCVCRCQPTLVPMRVGAVVCAVSVSADPRRCCARAVMVGADAEQTATGNHASASVLYASERRKITEKKLKKFFKKLLTFPKTCDIIYPEDERAKASDILL